MPKQTPAGRPKGAGPGGARVNPLLGFTDESELLFDLGGLLQAFDVVLEFLLHDAVGQLSLHLVERRVGGVRGLVAGPAVLGLAGIGREFAFLQTLDGIAEGFDHARRREPAEVAAIRLRIVGGFGFRDVFELCSALDLLDELIGLLLGRHQDVRSVILRLVRGGVVWRMKVLVRGLIALHVLLRGRVRQNLRAQESDTRGDFRILIQSVFLGLSRDELHVDHLIEDLILLIRGNVAQGFAAQQTFQVIIVGIARNGRAVDDGDRRRGRRRLVGGRGRGGQFSLYRPIPPICDGIWWKNCPGGNSGPEAGLGRRFPDRRESVHGGCGKNVLFFTLRKTPAQSSLLQAGGEASIANAWMSVFNRSSTAAYTRR